MKNDNAKSIVVLGSICLVVAILLSVVNHITAPIIEEAAGAAASESLKVVLPDATGFEEVELPEGTAETVTGIHKDQGGSGYAVTLVTSSSYSQSPMTFTVGFGTDGKIGGKEEIFGIFNAESILRAMWALTPHSVELSLPQA